MRITFLGTGTSTGVPYINCNCEVCKSADPRDSRLRASILVQEADTNILIDCGPDFRQQMLAHPVSHIDAVLVTHEHYDHVGGMDDLRPFKGVNVYAFERVCAAIRRNMPYCFRTTPYPGVPEVVLNVIDEENPAPLTIGGLNITPVKCMHAQLPILGYRIGSFAYMTDIKSITDAEFAKLIGVKTLVVDALRIEEHFSHFSLQEAIGFAKRVGSETTYFTHASHRIGLYAKLEPTLPQGMHLAYDNLQIDITL